MNHPHNKDECRIQRSGRRSVCSLPLQNLCLEVKKKNKKKNLYLILSKQSIRFLLGWHNYVFMHVWNGCAAFKSQIPEGFYNCSMHLTKFTEKQMGKQHLHVWYDPRTCQSLCVHNLDAQAPLELVNCTGDAAAAALIAPARPGEGCGCLTSRSDPTSARSDTPFQVWWDGADYQFYQGQSVINHSFTRCDVFVVLAWLSLFQVHGNLFRLGR